MGRHGHADVLVLGAAGTTRDDLVGPHAAALARLMPVASVPGAFCLTAFDPRGMPTLSPALRRDIKRAYANLAGRGSPAVAVRSSALDRDGTPVPFVGGHSTVVDVRGPDDVVSAVERCVRLMSSDETARIAVLVQRVVAVDATFAAFSRNPLPSGPDADEMIVHAVWGPTDAITLATSAPVTYIVARDTSAAADRCIVSLTRAMETPDHGLSEPAPLARRYGPPLDARALRQVVELVERIEDHLGYPVDIEGARVGDALFVTQACPITRTTRSPLIGLEEGTTSWLREDIHFPSVVTPAGGDYARLGMYAGLRRMQDEFGWTSRADSTVFNGCVYVRWHYMRPASELDGARAELHEHSLRRARHVVQVWDRTVMPRLREIYAWIDDLDVSDRNGQRVAAWRQLWSSVEEAWYWHFVVLYPCFAAARHLMATCQQLLGDDTAADALRLTAGHLESMHRVEVDLWALAEIARRSPGVVEMLGGRSADLVQLAEIDPRSTLLDELGHFVAIHGHLGADTDDLAATTWADEPWRVLGEIQRVLRAGTSPAARRTALLTAGDELLGALREQVNGPRDRERLEDAVSLARAVFPLAEDHNYWLDRMLHATVRAALRRLGDGLVVEGVIGQPDDIWYLYVDEVAQVLAAPSDCRDRVRRRRDELRAWSRLVPADRPIVDATATRRSRPQGTTVELQGVAASPGAAIGPARVVRTTADAAAAPAGGVLVCPNTNASWITLIAASRALVTSTGGELSHGAIVARELAIPAVVGVRGALDTIREGMLIEVDGNAGTVRILAGDSEGPRHVERPPGRTSRRVLRHRDLDHPTDDRE